MRNLIESISKDDFSRMPENVRKALRVFGVNPSQIQEYSYDDSESPLMSSVSLVEPNRFEFFLQDMIKTKKYGFYSMGKKGKFTTLFFQW